MTRAAPLVHGGRTEEGEHKGSNREESTDAGQDEDEHIEWVLGLETSVGGRLRVQIYCRQNGSFNLVSECTMPACQGKPGAQ